MKYSDICAIDSQGRVVIPSKIRKHLNIETGTSLELELYDREIRMRKCRNPLLDTKHLRDLLSILHHSIKHGVFLCNRGHIIASSGVFLPVDTELPKSLLSSIAQETEIFFDITQPMYLLPNHQEAVAALFPVQVRKTMALVVLSKSPLTDTEITCARMTAKTLEIEAVI